MALMAGVGVWMIASGRGGDQPPGYEVPFWSAWFGFLLYGAYGQATSAREILVHENDQVEFVGLLRRIRVPAQEIRSIRSTGGRFDHLVVEYEDGKVHLAGAFDDIHQFLTELSRASPGVRLSGC